MAVVILVPTLAIAALVTCVTLSHRAFAPLPLRDAHNASAIRSKGCNRPAAIGTGQLVYRTLDVGGLERDYLIWLPAHYEPDRPYPLLLSMHGATNSPIAQVSYWPDCRHRSRTAYNNTHGTRCSLVVCVRMWVGLGVLCWCFEGDRRLT